MSRAPTGTHPRERGTARRPGRWQAVAVTLDELRTLARAVEPLPVGRLPLASRDRVVAFNGAVGRFQERVVQARNALVLAQPVDPSLADELRMLAQTLPRTRGQVAAWAARA